MTRHLLREHLRKLLVGEMIKNGEDVEELYEMGLAKYVDEFFEEQETQKPKENKKDKKTKVSKDNNQENEKDEKLEDKDENSQNGN